MIRILASIGAIQVVVMLVGLVRAKALAVLLGPAGVGVVSTIDQWILTIVSLSALSVPFTAMKFMARDYSKGPDVFQHAFSLFLRTLAGLAGASVLGCLALLVWRPSTFGAELTPYRLNVALAVTLVPAFILNVFFVNTLAAARRARASAMVNLAFTAALAFGAIAGCAAGGITGLYALSVISAVVITAASAIFLTRHLEIRLSRPAGTLVAELRKNPEIVSYSLLLYAAMSAYSVTLLIGRYAVFSHLGPEEAGLMQAQMAIALAVGAVIAPMSNLYLTPLVNRDAPASAKAAAAHDFAAKAAIILLLSALPFVLFPQSALTILFSQQFAVAGQLLFIFMLWQCVYQMANVYLQLLVGLDDVLFFTVTTCGAYLAGVLLLPVFLGFVGGAGVGLALVATVVAAGGVAMLRLAIHFGIRPPLRVWWRLFLLLCAVLGAAAVSSVIPETTALGLFTRGSYIVLVCGLILLALTSEERRVMILPMRLLARP